MSAFFKSRTNCLVLIFSLVLVFYIGRLMQMQLIQGEEYESQIYKGTVKTQVVSAARGEILDRYGNPLANNRVSLNITLDKAFLPAEKQNETILRLMELLESTGEAWLDELPISQTEPYTFTESEDSASVVRLKKFAGVNDYADAQEVMHWLLIKLNLENPTEEELQKLREQGVSDEELPRTYTQQEQRRLAGVLYRMEMKGYNLSTPYTFAEDVSVSTATMIQENSLRTPGVDIEQSTARTYPDGTLAPHILGVVGSLWPEDVERLKAEGKDYALDDVIGKFGLEEYCEDELRGKDGERLVYVSQNGTVTGVVESVPPKAGNNVMLTLDSRLQRVARDALEAQIKHLQETAPPGEGKEANAGAAVAIDVKTGEVLALVNYPGYDLNTYYEDYSTLNADTENKPLFNRALLGTYTPGSIFKPVVGLAGLIAGEIQADSTVYCGHVYTYYAPSYMPTCLGFHKDITVMDALKYSCNIFFYDVGRRVGIQAINDTAQALGLGVDNGFELPTSQGQLSTPEQAEKVGEIWTGGDVIQSAIGQRFNKFSPLQLAAYCMNIANRGVQNRVTIIREIKDYSMEQTLYHHEPEVLAEMDVDPALFDPIFEGMVEASRTGTARAYFGNYPVDVASKTGTPETAELPNSTFICFAPADDPQIAISVVIEKGWHGYTGAPVARAILDAYFSSDMEGKEGGQTGVLLP